jgi:arginyl-tRNA synthetase
MSKREGDFVSVNQLLNEVDKNSVRFMMLNRSNDVELDFDFDKVLEKSKDNPFFMFNIVMQELILYSDL